MANTHAVELTHHERAIASLVQQTAVSPEQVRKIFSDEFQRLQTNAKVRTHLLALAMSNTRSLLRRPTRNP